MNQFKSYEVCRIYPGSYPHHDQIVIERTGEIQPGNVVRQWVRESQANPSRELRYGKGRVSTRLGIYALVLPRSPHSKRPIRTIEHVAAHSLPKELRPHYRPVNPEVRLQRQRKTAPTPPTKAEPAQGRPVLDLFHVVISFAWGDEARRAFQKLKGTPGAHAMQLLGFVETGKRPDEPQDPYSLDFWASGAGSLFDVENDRLVRTDRRAT